MYIEKYSSYYAQNRVRKAIEEQRGQLDGSCVLQSKIIKDLAGVEIVEIGRRKLICYLFGM